MRIRNALEWYDQNMHTDYPLVGSASAPDAVVGRADWTDTASSSQYLPKSFLVDIQINTPAVDGIETANRFYISKVYRTRDSLFVDVSYYSGGSGFICARSSAISLDIRNTYDVESRTVLLCAVPSDKAKYSKLSQLTGKLVIGSCVDMQDLGVMTFTYQATAIISARVNLFSISGSSDAGVSSAIVVVDSNGVEHKIDEDFTIQAGEGINLVVVENTVYVERELTDEEKLRVFPSVDAVVSAVLKRLGNPIYNINGISPDEKGTFYLRGGDCVRVTNSGPGVSISNSCSQPCCSSEQTVSELSLTLSNTELAIERLTQYYNALTTNVGAMQARLSSLIASRT